MRKVYNRLLIKVPILHSKEDMGSLGHRLVANNAYHTQTYDYWREIDTKIKNLPYDFRKIKIYQDGLPDTKLDLVERIVSEVQSPNYALLRWLKGKEATIVGTENSNLVTEEYQLLKAIFEAKDEDQKLEAKKRYQERANALLSLRDAYIAQKIDTTLKEEEVGILFIGAAHNIESVLAKDISVKYL